MIPIDPDQYDDEETHDGVVMKTHSSMDTDVRVLQQQIQQIQKDVQRIHTHLGQVILGQSTLIDDLLCCMLAEGHILIEGTPGLGKTLAVKALGRVLDLTLKRVQCTSDLMPNDILGGTQLIQDQLQTHTHFVQGPIFTQLLFVDEINRANPRTQSALLEAMAERQVSIEGKTQPLPKNGLN